MAWGQMLTPYGGCVNFPKLPKLAGPPLFHKKWDDNGHILMIVYDNT